MSSQPTLKIVFLTADILSGRSKLPDDITPDEFKQVQQHLTQLEPALVFHYPSTMSEDDCAGKLCRCDKHPAQLTEPDDVGKVGKDWSEEVREFLDGPDIIAFRDRAPSRGLSTQENLSEFDCVTRDLETHGSVSKDEDGYSVTAEVAEELEYESSIYEDTSEIEPGSNDATTANKLIAEPIPITPNSPVIRPLIEACDILPLRFSGKEQPVSESENGINFWTVKQVLHSAFRGFLQRHSTKGLLVLATYAGHFCIVQAGVSYDGRALDYMETGIFMLVILILWVFADFVVWLFWDVWD